MCTESSHTDLYTQAPQIIIFAMAILSQNHQEIDIAQLKLVSKVITEGGILMTSLTILPQICQLRENCHFLALGRSVSLKI